MGQIYMRDFKMVDQSDMIVSYVPELPNGKPGLSSGVERELHHAFEGGKEVYVVWACRGMPVPFITETATKVFQEHGRGAGALQAEGLHQVNPLPSWERAGRGGPWQPNSCQNRRDITPSPSFASALAPCGAEFAQLKPCFGPGSAIVN